MHGFPRVAAAGLILAGIAAVPDADAQWWNPFKPQNQNQNQAAGTGGQGNLVPPGDIRNNTTTTTTLPPPGGGAGTGAGGPPVVTGGGEGSRVERAEAQMRALTGQVEELTYQVKQLQDLVRRMRDDNEYRFQSLESGRPATGRQRSDAGATDRAPADKTGADRGATDKAGADKAGSDKGAADKTAVVTLGHAAGANTEEVPMDGQNVVGDDKIGEKIAGGQRRGDPPRNLGTLNTDATGAPINLSSLAGGGTGQGGGTGGGANTTVTGAAGTGTGAGAGSTGGGAGGTGGARVVSLSPGQVAGDPKAEYDQAYRFILAGDYVPAEKALRTFLAAYPEDKLAPDAQYWLGESLYSRSLFRDAADAFLKGYKTFPASARAPDMLLKLGLSLKGMGQRDAACSTYTEVIKRHPKASNALLQRVRIEQASAGC